MAPYTIHNTFNDLLFETTDRQEAERMFHGIAETGAHLYIVLLGPDKTWDVLAEHWRTREPQHKKKQQMKAYRIEIGDMDALFEGNSEQEALDNYARQSGYRSYEDMTQQPPHVVTVTEVPTPKKSADALALDEESWGLFVRYNVGILDDGDTDGNGLHLSDILAKKRREVLKYIGWY